MFLAAIITRPDGGGSAFFHIPLISLRNMVTVTSPIPFPMVLSLYSRSFGPDASKRDGEGALDLGVVKGGVPTKWVPLKEKILWKHPSYFYYNNSAVYVVSLGGDADIIGAMTGAIAGACYGR